MPAAKKVKVVLSIFCWGMVLVLRLISGFWSLGLMIV